VYLYVKPLEGSEEALKFLGALSPEHVGESAEERKLARDRIALVLSKFATGSYMVAAFAQTPSGAPYELETVSVVIR
jgi:hypothetical protein